MNRLIALCSFVLSLYGCEIGGQEAVQRTTVDGHDTLHSRVLARPGVTRFDCLRSASGACHYVVLPAACTGHAAHPGAVDAGDAMETADCSAAPAARRFTLRDGQTRREAGLRAFGVCVSTRRDAPVAACEAQQLLAAW